MNTIDLNNPPAPKPTSNTSTGVISRTANANDKIAAIEEKIDLILKYQKQTRRLAIAKVVFELIFVFIFIILPILGGIYLFRYIDNSFNLTEVRSQFIEFQDNISNLSEKSEKLDDITNGLPNLFNR